MKYKIKEIKALVLELRWAHLANILASQILALIKSDKTKTSFRAECSKLPSYMFRVASGSMHIEFMEHAKMTAVGNYAFCGVFFSEFQREDKTAATESFPQLCFHCNN